MWMMSLTSFLVRVAAFPIKRAQKTNSMAWPLDEKWDSFDSAKSMSLRGIDVQHKYHHPSPTVRFDPDSKKDQLLWLSGVW
jgi:hypothetical protein